MDGGLFGLREDGTFIDIHASVEDKSHEHQNLFDGVVSVSGVLSNQS